MAKDRRLGQELLFWDPVSGKSVPPVILLPRRELVRKSTLAVVLQRVVSRTGIDETGIDRWIACKHQLQELVTFVSSTRQDSGSVGSGVERRLERRVTGRDGDDVNASEGRNLRPESSMCALMERKL